MFAACTRSSSLRVLLAVAVLTVSGISVKTQVDPGLFADAPPSAAAPSPPDRPIVRQRLVQIDFERLQQALPDARGGANQARTLRLNLFPDVDVTAVLDRVERTERGYVWVGRLQTAQFSSVTLAVVDTVVAGTVNSGDAAYSIRYVGNGVHAVQQIDSGAFPPELPPLNAPTTPNNERRDFIAADDGSLIDVLVVYTPAARSLQGGTSAIQALIDLGISETNQAYASSGVIQRLRLVRKEEIAYTESSDMGTDLDRLSGTSDGFMDGVHALRNTYSADLVNLIENGTGACGIGYLLTNQGGAFESAAFSVTHYSCVSPNYSFGHELGHNMGLHHDIFVTGSATGTFAYSRGYVNQAAFAVGAPTNKRWRDIMAYNDQCAASGFNCTRLLAFSNPNNTNTGDPMGDVNTANAVLSLNNTRATVANFRQSLVPSLTIDDVSAIEGNSGTTNAAFTVRLSAPSASTVTVSYATADVTASAGSDYTAGSGQLTIPAGSVTQTVLVTVNGDTGIESSETFRVNLSNASGATIADAQGTGTIINDGFTDPSLSGVAVKTSHVSELRTLINERRAMRGLAAFSFTDPVLMGGGTPIKAAHITELRTALAAVYSAAGQAPPSYSESITAGATVIKAVHISEIRDKAVHAP